MKMYSVFLGFSGKKLKIFPRARLLAPKTLFFGKKQREIFCKKFLQARFARNKNNPILVHFSLKQTYFFRARFAHEKDRIFEKFNTI